MKSSRKIWSIPIAALALVLMLVGALAVTGIVQANTVLGVTLTGPDGNVVPLVMIDDGDADATTATAEYTFEYNAPAASYTGEFTVTVPTGREITVGTPTDDNGDVDGVQVDSELTPIARAQTLTVEHDLASPGTDTDRTLIINLALENAPPMPATQITDRVLAIDAGTFTNEADTVFADPNNDAIVFTAFTSNPKVVTLGYDGESDAVVGAWWNTLGGVSPTTTDDAELVTRCTAQNAALGLSGSNRDRTPADGTGICQTFSSIAAGDQATVTALFHWDLLTGDEMVAAAAAGGESKPSDYKKRFRNLDDDERKTVAALVSAGVIAQGSGTLTGTRLNTGTAEITVKASDAAGRFLAKSSDPHQFTITIPLSIIGPDNDLDTAGGQVDDDPMTDGIQIKTNLSGVAAGQAGADVVLITTDAILPTDGPAFLITGADADKFYASRAGVAGQITTGSILAAGTYNFTVTAALHGVDAAADVIVSVGHTNRPPEVVSGSTTSFMVLEQGQDGSTAEATVIHDFMANFNDPDREVDLTYTLEIIDDEDDGAVAFYDYLQFDGSALKTTDDAFAWDDPAENRRADNTHSYKVNVSDASGLSASQTITITLTNYIPPPPTPEPSTDIMVEENVVEFSVDNDEPAAIFEIRDDNGDLVDNNYRVIAQSPRGLFPDDFNDIVDPGTDRDTGEIWRADTSGDGKGQLWLVKGAESPDFEDPNYPNRYIIAVQAGPDPANELTVTKAFTVVITDINEAPEFEVDKDNGAGNAPGIAIDIETDAAKDPKWALYVLETTVIGGAVGQVRDGDGNLSDDATPGQLSAVDEDGDPITYSLMDWTDAGGHNNQGDDIVDDNELTAHTGPFAIDSSGNVTVNGLLDADLPGSGVFERLCGLCGPLRRTTMPMRRCRACSISPFMWWTLTNRRCFDNDSRTDGIAVRIDENSSGAQPSGHLRGLQVR